MSHKMRSDISKGTYHEIFMPYPDVYDLGGPEAFTEFSRKKSDTERNLIVIPFTFINQLSEMEGKSNSLGAADSLEHLQNLKKDKRLLNVGGNDFIFYRDTDALDVCLVMPYNKTEFSKPDFSLRKLHEELAKYVQCRDDNNNIISPPSILSVTNDKRTHIMINAGGYSVAEPEFLQVDESIVFKGIVTGNDDLQSTLRSNKDKLSLDKVTQMLGKELFMNQFIRFPGQPEQFAVVEGQRITNKSGTRTERVDNPQLRLLHAEEYAMKLRIGNLSLDNILGVSPLDMEQYLAMQYGLIPTPPQCKMFFLTGRAGSGKTILAYAYTAFATMVIDKEYRVKMGLLADTKGGFYRQAIIMKPINTLGDEELGFLPGEMMDKLAPHLRPFSDAHKETVLKDIAFDEMFKHPDYVKRGFYDVRSKDITNKKIMDMAHFPGHDEVFDLVFYGFIGGASLRNVVIMIDESQDIKPYVMKTICERIAPGTKLIITGDPKQVRNPKCSRKINGLTYAIKSFLPKPYSGLVALPRNYRDEISEDSDEMHVYN